ncbi:LysR family transcriptional regulator [Chitinophaga rhizophila]|uniref:LysR family transcriptional regulator n=1 Tax=Chitinophaga rhizophila TaxID=2866212 RepID=A0ABS7G6K7_9BACT|nr:LysR family transcriptional regulator [Chitinophaga rhizophila]MBW8683011.1 LysR family transcriptional regulator [Chitinophaga rhizophila]
MTTEQIRYFIALARELHFMKSAQKVNLTQSAFSRQIQNLENELQVRLFDRDNRNVSLTDAGRFLYDKWLPLLDTLEATQLYAQQLERGEQGVVRISHPPSISGTTIPEVVRKISSLYPKLKIELTQFVYGEEAEGLKNYRLDIAYTRDQLREDAIDSRYISTEPFAFVVSEKSNINTHEDLTPEILNRQKFIMPPLMPQSSYDMSMKSIIDKYAIQPGVLIESHFGSAILALIEKGYGISIMPISYEASQVKGVRFIPVAFNAELYINWRKNENSPVVERIIRLLAEDNGSM